MRQRSVTEKLWLCIFVGAASLISLVCVAGCSAQGTLNANNIKPAVDLVVDRHNKMLDGSLDPASISDADKKKFADTASLLKQVVDSAAQPDEVPN